VDGKSLIITLFKEIVGRYTWIFKYFEVRTLKKSKPQNIISSKKITRVVYLGTTFVAQGPLSEEPSS
jgi:hypothetical protein